MDTASQRDQEVNPHPPASTNPLRGQYKFTSEELRVLKECNRDSFYQRSLPLCALFSGGVYYAIKAGYLKGSPKYGATPKVFAAIVVGYFAGKFSYQRKCAEKLMQLPNSPIAEMLRQRKRGHVQETLEPGYGPAMSLGPFSGVGTQSYSDLDHNKSTDIDISRQPEIEGLNDSYRPSMDNPTYEEEMPPVQKHATTYDELRKQNRDDYQNSRVGNYRATESHSQSPTMSASLPKNEGPRRVGTNKYGDVME